jgi:DNA-binding NarL/FixJ family response regulator
LKKLALTPAIVICSAESDEEIIDAARQAGALAYVLKTRMVQDLVAAAKGAPRGVPFISSSL